MTETKTLKLTPEHMAAIARSRPEAVSLLQEFGLDECECMSSPRRTGMEFKIPPELATKFHADPRRQHFDVRVDQDPTTLFLVVDGSPENWLGACVHINRVPASDFSIGSRFWIDPVMFPHMGLTGREVQLEVVGHEAFMVELKVVATGQKTWLKDISELRVCNLAWVDKELELKSSSSHPD